MPGVAAIPARALLIDDPNGLCDAGDADRGAGAFRSIQRADGASGAGRVRS
jgi:hypothetical protein